MGVLAAETGKLLRHRAIWGLVWIFPVGLTVLVLAGFAWIHTHPHPKLDLEPPMTAALWVANTAKFWVAPGSGPGRCLAGAFAALAFGGEYGWNTWKLVAPHRSRIALLGAKYLAVVGLLMTAFCLMAALAVAFSAVSGALEHRLPPGIQAGDLFAEHARAALTTLLSTLMSVGYASLVSILLRSALAGTIAAVVGVAAEALALQFAPLINRNLFLALPSYHLRNLATWIEAHQGLRLPLPSGLLQLSWQTSLAVTGLWIAGMIGLTLGAFQRQDLN